MEFKFWCVACLKNVKEGRDAMSHPRHRTYKESGLSSKPGNGEHEMSCPNCGGEEFQVNVVFTLEEESSIAKDMCR